MAKTKFDITKHVLVPKHTKLSEKESERILKKHNITKEQLPKILKKDPAIKGLDVSEGDIIKIIRKSPTSGKIEYYRCVVNG